MKNIEIFTGPGCIHCEAAKVLLKKHEFPFEEYDISDPAVMKELQTRLPRTRSIPQIFADGEHLGKSEFHVVPSGVPSGPDIARTI